MPGIRWCLPLGPLLFAFRAERSGGACAGGRTPRATAIHRARSEWLNSSFLDSATPEQLIATVGEFYSAVSEPEWHLNAIRRNAGLLRHGLNHLLRGQEPLSVRYARCATAGGPYHVPGLGPRFWAAVLKALDPDRHPDWGRTVARGLSAVGLLPDGASQPPGDPGDGLKAFEHLLASNADLSADDLEDFLSRVGRMRGRELPPASGHPAGTPAAVADVLRTLRTQTPLRKRPAAFAERLAAARAALDAALAQGDHATAAAVGWAGTSGTDGPPPADVAAAFANVYAGLTTVRDASDLDRVGTASPQGSGARVRLAAGVLHLRDPNVFPEWHEPALRGLSVLDDAFDTALPPAVLYGLLCDAAGVLRRQFRIHPSEVTPLLTAVAETDSEEAPSGAAGGGALFGGFCTDTFRFLRELGTNNTKAWMADHRERYRFAVRDPLAELCDAVAERYVRPVLGGEYGWELETDAKAGRALTSIVKNDFGRSGPYVPVGWVTFYRRRLAHKRDDVQLFVRADANGVAVGFHLGRRAREAGRRFRANLQEHGALAFAALKATGAVDQCLFGGDTEVATAKPVRTAADLREWAAGKDLFAVRRFPPDAAVLRADEFVGEVLILFDRLVPLFAAAVEDDPRPVLATRAGAPDGRPAFDREAFRAATFLGDLWLTRALDLLRLKRQLVLQGVPGTGKTHVARCLARLITGDRPDAVRLVQFHPGYSYEEFVEGIRPKATEANGGTAVAYPVEPGLLAEFAERAERHPADPHVLVIDEVNRGNLPRVFGELLFLLEYRDQEVTLPYSKRAFRLPPNLYLVATMNPADRSTVGLDQAVRRRFSFVDLPPDPALLARWLDAHPPADPDPAFGPRVVEWFEAMNRRLARDLGPDRQVGHSVLMIPSLTAETLRAVWEHHVRPTLEECFVGHPERVRAFAPDRHLAPPRRAAGVP